MILLSKEKINKKACYEFVCDFKRSNLKFYYFLELVVEWNRLSREDKENNIRIIRSGRNFSEMDNAFGGVLCYRGYNNENFDLDEFRSFYDRWRKFTGQERRLVYGNITNNIRYKYDTAERTDQIEALLFKERMGKDTDFRRWDRTWAQKETMSYFRCRQCTTEFFAAPYELHCQECGSPNIYMIHTMY